MDGREQNHCHQQLAGRQAEPMGKSIYECSADQAEGGCRDPIREKHGGGVGARQATAFQDREVVEHNPRSEPRGREQSDRKEPEHGRPPCLTGWRARLGLLGGHVVVTRPVRLFSVPFGLAAEEKCQRDHGHGHHCPEEKI